MGLDINPTFTEGAFTGVSKIGLRVTLGTGKLTVTEPLPGQIAFHNSNAPTIQNCFFRSSGTDVIINSPSVSGNILFQAGTSTNSGKWYANGNLIVGSTAADAGYKLDVKGSGYFLSKVTYDATNTATGTTGNQTINKPSGTVNIASGGSTITVTNSLCTTSSIVTAVVRTNDANNVGIKSVVPSNGSFIITLTGAVAAEVSVGFIVYN